MTVYFDTKIGMSNQPVLPRIPNLNNSRIPIKTSPPTPLQTERGDGFVRAKSPSPVWERDLG